MTFKEAEAKLNSARSISKGKPIAPNTRLMPSATNADDIHIKLYNTNIITLHKDGTYTLDTGGWRTKLTLERMRRYVPFDIVTFAKNWWVAPKGRFTASEDQRFFEGRRYTFNGSWADSFKLAPNYIGED